jgi:hypothetical protein
MKVLTCSRTFHKDHPKKGQPTWFVEKIYKSIWGAHEGSTNPLHPYWEQYDQAFPVTGDFNENIHQHQPKHHTIRAGSRWKVGDMISLRVWSDKPYRSKQIEFAQVEVKKVWSIEINVIQTSPVIIIEGKRLTYEAGKELASNDGLSLTDFIGWFSIHPKKKSQLFTGQIICWSEIVEYSKPSTLTEKVKG